VILGVDTGMGTADVGYVRSGKRLVKVDRVKRRKREKARRDRTRGMIDALKNRPCADCGGTFDPICMDFDHRPGAVKTGGADGGISFMVRQGYSPQEIVDEIRGCDLVCANCHRLRTKHRGQHSSRTKASRVPQVDLPGVR